MTRIPSTLTLDELNQFTGGLERYRHPLNRQVIYTPGIQHLAERAGACWLIDEIALTLGSQAMAKRIAKDPRAGEMLFWCLTVRENQSAILKAEIDQGVPILRKRIAFTDFPLDRIDLWTAFDGVHWTLYLPSEH